MTLVVDASVVVAMLVDTGSAGAWAERALAVDDLAAPHLMPVEVVNILRRSVLAGQISSETATAAHGDLLDMPVGLFGYAPFADRVWQLRNNVTAYDAWYVALAERLQAPLATLDHRLSAATGPTCAFTTPTG